jgi:hypothetical protein
MKYLFILFTTLTTGFLVAQRPSIKFEATTPRLAKVGETVQLRAILSGKNQPEDLKWKIGGEEGKDWKFVEGSTNSSKEISIVFKKIGPTNVSLTAKAIVDSTLKGKKTPDPIKISLKYERKGYLLITELNEYSELNQLFAEGTVDSYIKLVKKASKLTENEKYAKDPFAYIWLARGLYSVHNENLDYTQGKYEPYKSAFNDAISALSKAMKYDNNNFLEESKFAEFIYELQFRYFDDIVASTLVETEEQGKTKGKKTTKDFGKINGSLAKYLKITKNPLCIKHLQAACMLNLNDANAKNTLKEAEAELVKYTASRDSVKFSPTDELFFATGVTELLKYYEIKKKTEDACSLQKRAEAALPELSSDRKRFEEWIDQRDPTGCN